jgi:hypothetical protein
MPRKILLPILLLGFGAVAVPSLAADTLLIQPGYWDVTNKIEAFVTKTTTEKRCITPASVAKFMLGPSNRHYKCQYPTRIFKDGKITLKGTCASKKGRNVLIEAKGSYSPTYFKLVADVDTTYAGLPLGGTFTTEAKRKGDECPPDAKTD